MRWGVLPVLSEYESASYEMMLHQDRGVKENKLNFTTDFDGGTKLDNEVISIPDGYAFTAVGELWEMRQCLEFGVDLFAALVLDGRPGRIVCTGNIGRASISRRAQVMGEAAKYFAKGGKKILLWSELSLMGYKHHNATKPMARVQVMLETEETKLRDDFLFTFDSRSITGKSFSKEIGLTKFLHMTTGMSSAEYGWKQNKRSARV